MRSVSAGSALALLTSGLLLLFARSSLAADLSNPVWEKAPDRSEWARAYPAQAAQAGVSGAVKMRCSASETGLLQNCTVVSEAPTGRGFGAAALSLANGMELKPTTADGRPVAGRSFIVPVKFDPGVLKGGVTIARPDWVRQPTMDELWNYVPAGLTMKGARVILHCTVTTHGLMADCTATTDAATNENVRKAVLEMSKLFVMRPMTVDGQPVAGGAINIPVAFEGGGRDDDNDLIRLIDDAPWLSAPTAAQMTAAYPKSALDIASGHAVLRCRIKADGRLSFCDAVSGEDRGFAAAAKSLTPYFQVNVDPQLQALNREGRVRLDLSFDFRNPNQPSPALGIQSPVWLKHFTAATVAEVYPAAAAKAGVRQGIGTVDCTVAPDGTLMACVVASEDPAGLGFGDAAIKLTTRLQMNPWTKQGAPVDGARVELPIRLTAPQAAPAK